MTIDSKKVRKLHLGGQQYHADWEIFDALPGEHVQHQGDAIDLSRFADNTFAEIYASHILEHFGIDEVPIVLSEWRRVLQPEGFLYISVPRLDLLCQLFIDPKLDIHQRMHVLNMIYGAQTTSYDFHKIGFTLEILIGCLASVGFTKAQIKDRFELFNDTSGVKLANGSYISLNVIAQK
ncbi:MAG: Methyltransferase type 11 [Chlamydiales bacterium]|jgi:predicted SAM-dependent methyltransferase|nr:Methyltransferase type 11 [Chlamydiales bacterium]